MIFRACPNCPLFIPCYYVSALLCPMVQVGQLGVSPYSIHNLGPVALGGVYPIETSTSLYNLYVSQATTGMYVQQTAPLVLVVVVKVMYFLCMASVTLCSSIRCKASATMCDL